MKVWIDADGCPRAARDLVLRAAQRRKFPMTLVANRHIPVPSRAPNVTSVQVSSGLDVADTYIVQHAEPGDLVITSDVPLAAELVEKGVEALDTRGQLYTSANVRERLSMRDFFTEARASGMIQGSGPAPYDEKAKRQFANALDRWITKHHKAS